MYILANDGMDQQGVEMLTAAGFQVSVEKIAQEALIAEINSKNIEVILVRSATTVRKNLIEACPGLKLIGRGGVGMDNIDVAYAREKGIKVINTPASSSGSVAELVFAHMFNLSRFLYDANRQMPSNGYAEFNGLKKKYAKGVELRGKTLGIIGFGRIGQSVASYGLGLGMKIKAFDLIAGERKIKVDIAGLNSVEVSISTSSMEDVLAASDFITLHIPAQKDGGPAIGETEINRMKDGVFLINAARGGVIDEEALLKALDTGKIRAAGLDVFANEPAPDQRLLQHAKISLSPHIGAATMEAQERISIELADQIISTFQTA